MQDNELPVKIEAAKALPRLLIWEIAKENVAREVGNLLNIYKNLMNEIDSEELVDALEDIVGKFSFEMMPYALDLTEHLVLNFMRLSCKDSKEDDGESTMAAISILNTISKIIDVLEERPDDLVKISFLLIPILDYCLSLTGKDYFEEALHALTFLLYFAPENSLNHMYKYTNFLKLALIGDEITQPFGKDHLEEVFSPIANFISKYKPLTIGNLGIFLEIAGKYLKEDEQEILMGCKILLSLLENFRGKIDVLIPKIVVNVYQATYNLSKKIRVTGCQVLCVALWNSPIITAQALLQNNALISIISFAINEITQFKENMSKTHLILGLSSLLPICEILPQIIVENFPEIFKKIIYLYTFTKNDDTAHRSQDKFYNESGVFVDAEQFHAQYQNMISDINFQKCLENSSSESDDDNFGFSTEPEDLYDSIFESLDIAELIKNILHDLATKNLELYQHITSKLTEKEIETLTTIIN